MIQRKGRKAKAGVRATAGRIRNARTRKVQIGLTQRINKKMMDQFQAELEVTLGVSRSLGLRMQVRRNVVSWIRRALK
jgi:hypothetical protein